MINPAQVAAALGPIVSIQGRKGENCRSNFQDEVLRQPLVDTICQVSQRIRALEAISLFMPHPLCMDEIIILVAFHPPSISPTAKPSDGMTRLRHLSSKDLGLIES